MKKFLQTWKDGLDGRGSRIRLATGFLLPHMHWVDGLKEKYWKFLVVWKEYCSNWNLGEYCQLGGNLRRILELLKNKINN